MLVGYESAVQAWRELGPGYLGTPEERRAATRKAAKALRLSEKPQLPGEQWRPLGMSMPVQALVGSGAARVRTACVESHIWQEAPDRSFVEAGGGFLLSTPEFCFLQMAGRLSFAKLVLLGYELCGTYALSENGPAQRTDAPLASALKLQAFSEGAAGARGRKMALLASRYVMDGSASPMESMLAMMLCLPYGRGGYGLPAPSLNHRVTIPKRERKRADRAYCECDLCWPEARLAVEYDSDLYHSSEARHDSDSKRRNTLAALDFTVITVSRGQIVDAGSFNRLANQLAKMLRKRLRYQDPAFTQAHLALRDELLGGLSRRE